jgi:hypothetical protein
MSANNGGPAFPTTTANYMNENALGEGLTLRDYFAAKAMQQMAGGGHTTWADLAADAYAIADMMLLERAK